MMRLDKRKVVLVGTGLVGMSFAYALLNQSGCDELVLIDIDREKAVGEAMDLNHGLAFAGSNMQISAGEYSDCADADIVVICAGVAQKPGESRIDLLQRNTAVFHSILQPVIDAGFHGIFLVATNPVDILTRVTQRLSHFAPAQVIGTGTTLDTARLRYLLGAAFQIDPRNVHAYVMGEHGDSEFVPWSQAMIATKSIQQICAEHADRFHWDEIREIEPQVRNAAQEIIRAKKATYYGIGMSLVRIVRAIFGNENSILTVSAQCKDVYGLDGVYAGVPCVINRSGVGEILELQLTREELAQLQSSCRLLEDAYDGIRF